MKKLSVFGRIGSVLKSAMRWSGIGGTSGSSSGYVRRNPILYGLLPGTRLDFKQKAGDVWKNSVVSICLFWWGLSFPEAKFCVKTVKQDGTEEPNHTHALSLLVRKPNPFSGPRKLWFATLISYLGDGNAYWIKVRGAMGQVVQLWYVPHYEMEPRWPGDGQDLPGQPGSGFISHYERMVDGQWHRIEKSEVVHFAFGQDPDNTRKGLSPLRAQLRHIFSDNEIATYYAGLLENAGICTILISAAGESAEIDDDEAEKLGKLIKGRTTGDERGKPIVTPVPIKVDRLAFNPEEMLVKETSAHQTSRTCAALMIDPMVVGLPSETNTHYDNREQAERGAWCNGILPVMEMLSEDADRQLGPEFQLKANEACGFDTKHIRALQVDLKEMLKALVHAAGGSVLTPDEARGLVDYQPLNTPESTKLRERSLPMLGDDDKQRDQTDRDEAQKRAAKAWEQLAAASTTSPRRQIADRWRTLERV